MSLFSLKFHNMKMKKKTNPVLIISCRIIKITLIKCGKYQQWSLPGPHHEETKCSTPNEKDWHGPTTISHAHLHMCSASRFRGNNKDIFNLNWKNISNVLGYVQTPWHPYNTFISKKHCHLHVFLPSLESRYQRCHSTQPLQAKDERTIQLPWAHLELTKLRLEPKAPDSQ